MLVETRGESIFKSDVLWNVKRENGASGGNRTHTPVREPDFESGASTSSATEARGRAYMMYFNTYCKYIL